MSYSAIVMALLVQKRLISIMAQFNPVSYWGSALLKKTRSPGCISGKCCLELSTVVNIFILSPSVETAQDQDSHLKEL